MKVSLRYAAIVFAGLMAAAICVAQSPWDKLDWTKWTESDCNKVLRSSPWSQGSIDPHILKETPSPQTPPTFSTFLYYMVQIRSALPVQRAVMRLAQIQNGYDKMDAKERQAFDQKAGADIARSYSDRIVVRVIVINGSPGNEGNVVPRLLRSDAGEVEPLSIEYSENRADNYVWFDVVFPRTANGQSILKPGDKKLRFAVNYAQHVDFPLDKMVYMGKLEY